MTSPQTRIERKLAGYAYPRNGNVLNPTPRYVWAAYHDGQLVTYGKMTKRKALAVLRDLGVTGPVPTVKL